MTSNERLDLMLDAMDALPRNYFHFVNFDEMHAKHAKHVFDADVFIVELVDASSAAPEAEDAPVLLAIWGLVRALLDVWNYCNHDKTVHAVDSEQCSCGCRRAAGMKGDSR